MTDKMRYWESLPGMINERDARCTTEAVKTFFSVDVAIVPDVLQLPEGVVIPKGVRIPGDPPTVYRFDLPADLPEDKRLLIECFIVAYARGFETANILATTGQRR